MTVTLLKTPLLTGLLVGALSVMPVNVQAEVQQTAQSSNPVVLAKSGVSGHIGTGGRNDIENTSIPAASPWYSSFATFEFACALFGAGLIGLGYLFRNTIKSAILRGELETLLTNQKLTSGGIVQANKLIDSLGKLNDKKASDLIKTVEPILYRKKLQCLLDYMKLRPILQNSASDKKSAYELGIQGLKSTDSNTVVIAIKLLSYSQDKKAIPVLIDTLIRHLNNSDFVFEIKFALESLSYNKEHPLYGDNEDALLEIGSNVLQSKGIPFDLFKWACELLVKSENKKAVDLLLPFFDCNELKFSEIAGAALNALSEKTHINYVKPVTHNTRVINPGFKKVTVENYLPPLDISSFDLQTVGHRSSSEVGDIYQACGNWVSDDISESVNTLKTLQNSNGRLTIVYGTDRGMIKICQEQADGTIKIRTLNAHKASVNSIQISFNTNELLIIVSGSNDNTLKIWQEQSNGAFDVQTLEHCPSRSRINTVQMLRNSSGHITIVSGNSDKTVKVYKERPNGTFKIQTLESVTNSDSAIDSLALIADTHGRLTIVSSSGTRGAPIIIRKELSNGTYKTCALIEHTEGVSSIHMDQNSKGLLTIVSGSYDTTIKIWQEQKNGTFNINTLKAINPKPEEKRDFMEDSISSLALSHDKLGHLIMLSEIHKPRSIKIWKELPDGTYIMRSITAPTVYSPELARDTQGHLTITGHDSSNIQIIRNVEKLFDKLEPDMLVYFKRSSFRFFWKTIGSS